MNMNRYNAIYHVLKLLIIILIFIIITIKVPGFGSGHLLAWQHTHLCCTAWAVIWCLLNSRLITLRCRGNIVSSRPAQHASLMKKAVSYAFVCAFFVVVYVSFVCSGAVTKRFGHSCAQSLCAKQLSFAQKMQPIPFFINFTGMYMATK